MKKSHHWGQLTAFASIVSLSGAMLTAPAIAINQTLSNLNQSNENSIQLAQASESFCRVVTAPSGLVVRERPNNDSARVGGIAYNNTVTLVQGYEGIKDSDGRIWVEIAGPVRGYISNGFSEGSNLGYCNNTTRTPATTTTTTTTTTTANNNDLCRIVSRETAPRGLAIRANPVGTSEYRGGVEAGGRVTLVANYRLVSDQSGANRNWVQIAEPIAGYVAAANLVMCP